MTPPDCPYRLITVEGNIGAGKTTLARRLAEDLNGRLVLERFEDNPFLPQFFSDFKEKAFPTELFFLAERYHQLQREMQGPGLFHERVVMDYLFTKSLLYAKANLDEAEFQLFQQLFEIINPRLPEPELVVYLHADVDRLVANIRRRGRDFEQNVDPDYLRRIEANWFAWFHQHPHLRILVLDNTEGDFVAHPGQYAWILEEVCRPREAGLHPRVVGRDGEAPMPG